MNCQDYIVSEIDEDGYGEEPDAENEQEIQLEQEVDPSEEDALVESDTS